MADDQKHEIVIIHRGGHGDHEEHHGGVWKIAFADFMTAMMAFFLVMWLISANEKTRASIARYFNPVRLVDATTQPRGLKDPKKDESGITATSDAKPSDKQKGNKPAETQDPSGSQRSAETPAAKVKRLDNALRENPYVALAEIASAKDQGDLSAKADTRQSPSIGRAGGEAFRDPFAPLPPATADTAAKEDASSAPSDAMNAAEKDRAKAEAVAPSHREDSALKARILAAVATKNVGPGIDVAQTPEGLVVSLTDTANFSMFANGSAVPARRVVLMMEGIAKILKGQQGAVVVRGYTDNKPFRSGRYDNWHLSLDRAQVAHYMLVRGGLADMRIAHVEGYADRGARPGVDPSSPINRRIEILLKDDAR